VKPQIITGLIFLKTNVGSVLPKRRLMKVRKKISSQRQILEKSHLTFVSPMKNLSAIIGFKDNRKPFAL